MVNQAGNTSLTSGGPITVIVDIMVDITAYLGPTDFLKQITGGNG